MSSVWQLSNEMERVDYLLDLQAQQNDGEVDAELDAFFDQLKDELRENAEGYAALYRKRKAEAEMLKLQSKRFAEESQRAASFCERMKENIKEAMDLAGIKKLDVFSVCKNGGKLPLEITGPVDEEYIRYEPVQDTQKIREALDAEADLAFAKYGERGTHVRVKI